MQCLISRHRNTSQETPGGGEIVLSLIGVVISELCLHLLSSSTIHFSPSAFPVSASYLFYFSCICRLAREEILADTKRAKTRAETLGAVGW